MGVGSASTGTAAVGPTAPGTIAAFEMIPHYEKREDETLAEKLWEFKDRLQDVAAFLCSEPVFRTV